MKNTESRALQDGSVLESSSTATVKLKLVTIYQRKIQGVYTLVVRFSWFFGPDQTRYITKNSFYDIYFATEHLKHWCVMG